MDPPNFIDVTSSWIFVGFIVQTLTAMGLFRESAPHPPGPTSGLSFIVQQLVT